MEWSEFFEWLMDRESREVTNDPRDPGGQTAWGISRRYWPLWEGWALVDNSITSGPQFEQTVRDFYWANYGALWVLAPVRVRAVLVDTAVNMGKLYAGQLMQYSLCRLAQSDYVDIDGVLGPQTREALRHADHSGLAFTMCALRQAEYNRRARRDPDKRVFLSGWLNRVGALMEVL